MRLILKLLNFVYAIIFIGVFATLFILCISYNSLKPDSLMDSLGKVNYDSIKIKDFRSASLDEKYGTESTVTDLLIKDFTDEKLSKEDATQLVNSDIYKKLFFESAFTNLRTGKAKEYTEVELKEKLASLNIKNLDYKRAAEILQNKASEVKIKDYANTKVYQEIGKRITDVSTYLIVFTIISYIILAIFSLSMTKPMQLVGYPIVIIGTISICLSILLETIISKALNPAYKIIIAPIFKDSLLKYGIMALAFGMILAIIYEIISRRKPDYDKNLYSFTIAPKVNANAAPVSPESLASSVSPDQDVTPLENSNPFNNQIS